MNQQTVKNPTRGNEWLYIDKGQRSYKGHIGADAKCDRCGSNRRDHRSLDNNEERC